MTYTRLERTIHGIQQLRDIKNDADFLELQPDMIIMRPPGDSKALVQVVAVLLCLAPIAYLLYISQVGYDSWITPVLLPVICFFLVHRILRLTEGQQHVVIDLQQRVFEFRPVHMMLRNARRRRIYFDEVADVVMEEVYFNRTPVHRIMLMNRDKRRIAFFDLSPEYCSVYTAEKLRLLFAVIINTPH